MTKSTDPLQWLRELMAVGISLAILVLTVAMMWMTFQSAGATDRVRVPGADGSVLSPSADAAKEARSYQTESYNRQKDIMLYGLALLGTVTGYYLGRVPAEINAKRAENAAETAQRQLTRTQDQLASSAGSVARTQTELGQVREQKSKATNQLKSSTKALRDVKAVLTAPAVGGRGGLSGDDEEESASLGVQQAIARIDTALQNIESDMLE